MNTCLRKFGADKAFKKIFRYYRPFHQQGFFQETQFLQCNSVMC